MLIAILIMCILSTLALMFCVFGIMWEGHDKKKARKLISGFKTDEIIDELNRRKKTEKESHAKRVLRFDLALNDGDNQNTLN